MKYIKIIFIFFISLNLSALCAETSTPIELITADAPTQENELQDWNDHLKKLEIKGDNWVADNNIPSDNWTTEAFDIAEKAMTANNTLSEELKTSFSNAIKEKITQEGGAVTLSPEILMEKFDKKIEELKNKTASEIVVEESTTAASAQEKISTTEPEQAPEVEVVTASTETTTPTANTSSTETTTTASSTESKTEPEKKEESKEEEKKEDLLKEWKQCLTNMQSRQGDIDTLTNKAAELAQKLHDSNSMDERKLTQAFTAALEGATVVRQLPSYYKDDALSDFASALGIYIPTSVSSMDYYQPTQSELTMLAQQEELAEMQRKQMEQDERLKTAEREAEHQRMITQAALLEATKKQQLSVDQWQKTQESLMKAEQRRLTQLQEEADQLKEKTKELELKLQKAAAEQKTAAEKSLLTRAKEKVSETVSWLMGGSSEPTKPAEEAIDTKEELIKQRQRLENIIQEQEKLSKEMRCKREQKELRALKNEERKHELSQQEIERKAELEAEQRECERIVARNNFERQEKEWPVFMDEIRNMENPTRESNNKATKEAIERATSLINLASGIPSIKISDLEQMLKETFAKALVDQKHRIQHALNIVVNQGHFNNAINDIEGKIKAMQPTRQEMYNRE